MSKIPDNELVYLRVILKSGNEFTIKTKNFLIRHGTRINELSLTDCVENFPVFLDFDEIAAIVRVFSNEKGEDIE